VAVVAGLALVGCSGEAAGAASRRTEAEAAANAAREGDDPVQREPVELGPPKRIYAKRYVAKVRAAASREAERIGYLRAGSTLMATTARPVGFDGCRGGWYELTTGGFVCNGRTVVAFDGERLPERPPAVPDRQAKLPYRYAVNRKNKVAVYRRLPTDEEAVEFEGYVIPGTEPPPKAAGEDAGGAEDGATADGEDTAAADGDDGAGSGSTAGADGGGRGRAAAEAERAGKAGRASSETGGAAEEAAGGPSAERRDVSAAEEADGPPAPGNATAAGERGAASQDPMAEELAEEDEEELDAGPPTLDDLQGEEDSVLMRWMLKGFYVSLDREFRIGRRRYWRTLSNEYIPHRALYEVEGSDFEGRPLDGHDWTLPVGYLLSSRDHAYTVDERGRLRRAGEPGYHHVFRVVGQEDHGGRTYYVGPDSRRYRADETTLVEVPERPDGIPPGVKWIDVDLTDQTLVAMEGDRPVFTTLVSTGRVKQPDDPEQDHETPSGVFQVTSKHLTGMMDGDNAIDGPYSIQDVPYIMYFELAYAFHSAFWHNRFGRTKSHGCVNLSPRDARRLFEWADPPLPTGWHGVYPNEDNPGTWVSIHGTTPEG
jgi:hypothetical protein